MEKKKLTKYEHARIIGARALQISMGAPFLLKLSEEELQKVKYNPVEIAKLEFEKGLIPMDVVAPMPKTKERRELPVPKPTEIPADAQ